MGRSKAPEISVHERELYEAEEELKDMELYDDVESQAGATASSSGRSKHMSMELAGSVFLIASDGRVLNLPIPSESPDDPLTWSQSRRKFIISILVLYAGLAMFLIQTPGTLYKAFLAQFSKEVRELIMISMVKSSSASDWSEDD